MTEERQQARPDPDGDLVSQAQRELPYVCVAYESLIRRHQRLLYAVCVRMLGSHADADDVCQEVMIRVFNGLPTFEGRSTFKTWMMRIAANSCLTTQRKAGRRQEISTMFEASVEGETSSRLETSGMDVETLLGQIGEQERLLLTLRFVAELSFEEVADACNLGLSATKMRIYRAVERLRALTEVEQARNR